MRNREDLPITEHAKLIIDSRTPASSDVIYPLTVRFVDPGHELTREEIANVVAKGDRTAISYELIAKKVIAERGKTVTREDEVVSANSNFFLLYALSARDSTQVSHTSIQEQVGAGPDENNGDSPIGISGVSIRTALQDLAVDQWSSFEAFSSRGAIFPEGYWRHDPVLFAAGIGPELEARSKDLYRLYKDEFLPAGLKYYLEHEQPRPGELGKNYWLYEWRVLSMALDDARQITNSTFLCQLAFHPNSALALRNTIVRMAAGEYPESRELANRLRDLTKLSLPTLVRYTDASPFTESLSRKKRDLITDLQINKPNSLRGVQGEARLIRAQIDDNPERVFLTNFLSTQSEVADDDVNNRVFSMTDSEVERAVKGIASGYSVHDILPPGIEKIYGRVKVLTSVGGLFDSLRHRVLQHRYSRLSPDLGFTMPRVYEELGLEKQYRQAIALTEEQRDLVIGLGPNYEEAFGQQYVARGHLVYHEFSGPMPGILHYERVRATPNAHPDVSGPAYQLKDYLTKKAPVIMENFFGK